MINMEQIIPRDTSERTCFMCANSFVDDDKLHCMADNHDHEKTVEDDQTCDDWN